MLHLAAALFFSAITISMLAWIIAAMRRESAPMARALGLVPSPRPLVRSYRIRPARTVRRQPALQPRLLRAAA